MADLKSWIDEQKAKGFTEDQLKEHLKKNGYDDAKINEAFTPEPPSPQLSTAEQPTPNPVPEQTTIPEGSLPKKSKSINFIIIGVIAVLAIAFIVYLNMGPTNCPDEACFTENLKKCEKAVFVSEGNDGKIRQTITSGRSLDEQGNIEWCNVKTEVLTSPIQEVVGLSMVCKMPISSISIPECNGELWEYTQAQMQAALDAMGDLISNTTSGGMPDVDLPDGFPSLDFP